MAIPATMLTAIVPVIMLDITSPIAVSVLVPLVSHIEKPITKPMIVYPINSPMIVGIAVAMLPNAKMVLMSIIFDFLLWWPPHFRLVYFVE